MKNKQPMMRGDDVEELQESLNQLGYDISVDGYYGNETADAVKDYQTSKGLGVDGKVGPNTREEIMKDLGIEVETDKVTIIEEIGKNLKVDPFYYKDSGIGVLDVYYKGDNFQPGIKLIGAEAAFKYDELGAKVFLYNPNIKLKVVDNEVATLYIELGFYVGIGAKAKLTTTETSISIAKGVGGEAGFKIEKKEYDLLPPAQIPVY